MSDEHREIEVVEMGSGPPRPARPSRTGNRTDVLLTLMVLGVFVGAGCSAFTAWTVHEQAKDTRELNCAYVTAGGSGERDYDDLEDYEKGVVDAMDCDIEGR